MVNLELYRVFYTVARCGSLTKAAEELYISQPAVSQAVKQLEGEHDFRNFCRIDAVNVCDFTRTIFHGDVIDIAKGYWCHSRSLLETFRNTTFWRSKS